MLASRLAAYGDELPAQAKIERRQYRRHRMLERIARIDTLGDNGLCHLQNVSDGGVMISTSIALSIGNPVRLAFDCSNHVQGRVTWQSSDRAGIRFLQPIDSSALIRKVVSDRWNGSARSPRLSVSYTARVTTDSGSFPTVIGNISQRGMNICHGGHLERATVIDISLESGVTVRGTVRWSAGFFAGIELAETLSVELLASARTLQVSGSLLSGRSAALSPPSTHL